MADIIVEILSGLFSLILFLLLLFSMYPEMKKEWTSKGRDYRYYYSVCGDDNRISYREYFYYLISNIIRK